MAKAKAKSRSKSKAVATAPASRRSETAGSFQNKLSVKTVCGDVKALFPEGAKNGTEIDLMTIYGVARDFKQKDSGDKGIWTAFIGDFAAMRTSDGKRFRSAKCFLPGMATELLVTALTEQKRQADEAIKAGQPSPLVSVEFAFEIGATYDDTVSVRYHYNCEPRMQQTSDAISRIEQMIALPPPK